MGEGASFPYQHRFLGTQCNDFVRNIVMQMINVED